MDKTGRIREGKSLQVYLPVKLMKAIRRRKVETGLSITFAAEKLFAWWASGGDLSALPSAPSGAGAERGKRQ